MKRPLPTWLSPLPEKRDLYGADPYFRDAWEDITARWEEDVARRLLFQVAPIVFRPDALVVRGVERALGVLGSAGFVQSCGAKLQFDRLMMRECWRYQINVASPDRIEIMELLMSSGPSFYVLTRREIGTSRSIPNIALLNDLKGPTNPEDRKPGQLRTVIGFSQSPVFTYVHAGDDPADIVRELGLFFSKRDRLDILQCMERSIVGDADVEQCLEGLYENSRTHDLLFFESLDRVSALAKAANPLGDLGRSIQRECEKLRSGPSRDWRSLLGLLDAAEIAVSNWDRIAIAAPLAEPYKGSDVALLPAVSLMDWTGS